MEYSMILLDNSDYSRNGDYIPSRWEAQVDAAFTISNSKLTQNQESAIGFITLAGKQPQVLLTPTNEDLKIQASLYGVKQQGKIHFKSALSIAFLALKHRKNAHARQRITVFVASPVEEDEKALVQLAKTLKKNSVAVDLINIGQMDQAHVSKLEKFIETVNKEDNSHFKNIEPGLGRIEDKLIGTPFIGANDFGAGQNFGGDVGGGANVGAGAAGNFDEWGGIDPSADPELAEVMRQSILEAKKMEEEAKKAEQGSQQQQDGNKMEEEKKTEEGAQNNNNNQNNNTEEKNIENDLIERAQKISIEEKQEEGQQQSQGVQDPDFMNELLDGVDGLDKDNEQIQEVLKSLQDGGDKKNDGGDKKDEDKK